MSGLTLDAATSDAASRAPGLPLDLHEGIDALRATGCDRWPDDLRLRSTLGDLVPGRCKATNLCGYCARLAAVETAEVLALDAMANSAPEVFSVLTTRTATLDMRRFRRGREAVRRAVVRRWPDARAATLVEFQTGRGTRSEGKRRPHWNDLWKGIPADEAARLQEVAAVAWTRHVDAEVGGQHAQAVTEAGGLMRYLALHFQKQDQAPPLGWRGHRFRTMSGYLAQPMVAARLEARESLRFKRELWRALQEGLEGLEAEEAAHFQLYAANKLSWSLVRLQDVPTAFDDDGLPAAWETIEAPVR